jgi:putative tricarboxylic transport membrane protein
MSDASTRTDRVAGILVAVLGLAVGADATTFDVLFRTDPLGPKVLPMLAAAVFLGSGLYLAARPGTRDAWPTRSALVRMAGAVAAFGVYAALLSPLGCVVATTATVSALSILFGGPLKKAVTAALTLSVVLWYLFVWALGLTLPLGSVWEALWMR